MSAFPQIIWRPTTKDVVTEFAPRTVFFSAQNAQAAAVVAVQSEVPPSKNIIPIDQVLILTHCSVRALPGAAQNVTNVTVHVLQESSSITQLIGDAENLPAATQIFRSWQGEIVLTNTERLSAAGSFSAAAAVNTVTITLAGYFVPRGNWQR